MPSSLIFLCIAFVTILQPASSSKESVEFMQRFGYLKAIDGGEQLYDEEAIAEALRMVQLFGSIPQTGKLDNDTIKLMESARCGVEDLPVEGRSKRYVIASQGWYKRHLTYNLMNWTPKLDRGQVLRELQKAMDEWGKYARLTFKESTDPSADIRIGFYTGDHGDRYPFDGPGRVLAHAYFPSRGSLGGDMHFDDEEPWLINPSPYADGVDFSAVALHELGHSLGLSHSPEKGSVMNPYYHSASRSLGHDDVLAMHHLYINRKLDDDDETSTTPMDHPSTGRPWVPRRPTHTHTTPRYHETTRGQHETTPTYHHTTTHRNHHTTSGHRETTRHQHWTTPPTTTPYYSSTSEQNYPSSTWGYSSSEKDREASSSSTVEPDITYEGDDESVDKHKEHDHKHGIPSEGGKWTPHYTVVDDSSTEQYHADRTSTEHYPSRTPPRQDTHDDSGEKPKHLGCQGDFSAVGLIRGEIFIIKNQSLWRLFRRGKVQPGYPVTFSRFFNKLPKEVTQLDAMYQRDTDSSIVLFSGKMYWVFNGFNFIEGSPRPITDYGLPPSISKVDAAMIWKRNSKTYLFSGDNFWRYNGTTKEVDAGYPKLITESWKVPKNIDAALTDSDGITYFFKGDDYWAFDNKKVQPLPGYPRSASDDWLNC